MPENQNALQAHIRGPFWTAEATIVGNSASDAVARSVRMLFVETSARAAFGSDKIHLPGTFLTLCVVHNVAVQPSAAVGYRWHQAPNAPAPDLSIEQALRNSLRTGALALLLLRADPKSLAEGSTDFDCVAGEIMLDPMTAEQDAANRLAAALGLQAPSAMVLDATGVSLRGSMKLPWQTAAVTGAFILAHTLPAVKPDMFRFTLDIERMTDDDRDGFRRAWQTLSRAINPPHPLNDMPAILPTPTWATFEIVNPLAVPRLSWDVANWTTATPTRTLHFADDEISILLSDQSPYDQDNRASSLAQIAPQVITLVPDGDNLVVTVESGKPVVDAKATALTFTWDAKATDRVTLTPLSAAFDPVQTPQSLRLAQGLTAPEWPPADFDPKQADRNDGAIEQPVLWCFMPLEEGWAQLPLPNLTEGVYVETDLVQPVRLDEQQASAGVLRGAVSLGNDAAETLAAFPDEQAWNLTVTAAQHLRGSWRLTKATGGDGTYTLTHVEITLTALDVMLNGFLWLSTRRPTVEDALPDLSDWTASVRQVSLKSTRAEDVFPPLVKLAFDALTLSLRHDSTTTPKSRASAQIAPWSFAYQADATVLAKLTAGTPDKPRVLPENVFTAHLPLVWRRHPRLPMVQALPLTQNRLSPNYPSASRQLVPYQLELAEQPLPTTQWRFSCGGASAWPRVAVDALVADEWGKAVVDLPLVSLSLPGLMLDPQAKATGLPADAGLQLPTQFRYDLPYLDQPNALAKLPKMPRKPDEVSPLPDQQPPAPPKPLTRETFAEYWQSLSTLASLAAADAVDAFRRPSSAAGAEVQSLVEPHVWPVQPQLKLNTYPGSLDVQTGDADPLTLHFEGESALRGFQGDFALDAGGHLQRVAGGANSFHIEAGSMAAHREHDGAYRDQRGLTRGATAATAQVLRTPLKLLNDATSQERTLVTAMQPLTLSVDATPWQFWFRDLPMTTDVPSTFRRADTLSEVASSRHTDINDPEARSRAQNHLAGYEWRLGDSGTSAGLTLAGLYFYPLTLEALTLAGDEVTTVEIIGRLQLPLGQPREKEELTDLSNAVRLSFTRQANATMALTAVTQVAPMGIWPLALTPKNRELTDAPRIEWGAITLAGSGAERTLQIGEARVRFHLFGVAWSVALEPLTFALKPPQATIERSMSFPVTTAPIFASKLHLTLNPTKQGEAPHAASMVVKLQLGERRSAAAQPGSIKRRVAFEADMVFPLVGDTETRKPKWDRPALFHDLNLGGDDKAVVEYSSHGAGHAFQFQWSTFNQRDELGGQRLYLFPGMPLLLAELPETGYAEAPGFAALTFGVTAQPSGIPEFTLNTAFVETLLNCAWGAYLSEATSPINAADLFNASSGNVAFAYTGRWRNEDATWEETFLLNGFVEVASLISWPLDMRYDAAKAEVTLPAARGANTPASLDHTRHAMRVLLNQHVIPPQLPVIGEDNLLFNFGDAPWQFLAVVEHQLVDVRPVAMRALHTRRAGKRVVKPVRSAKATPTQYALSNDRRWTATQEVRLITPRALRTFLETTGGDDFSAAPFTIPTQVNWKLVDIKQGECDVNESKGALVVSIDNPAARRGTHWVGNDGNTQGFCGLRYLDVPVPRGTKILNAVLQLFPSEDSNAEVRVSVFGDAVGNSATFTTTSRPSQRTPTQARAQVNLGKGVPWTKGELQVFADVTDVVQEIVNRGDWAAGNALSLVIRGEGGARRFFVGRERDFGTTARLVINIPPLSPSSTKLGYFNDELRTLLLTGPSPELSDSKLPKTLMVEASAPHWVKQHAADQPTFTTLQYLPFGGQLAAPSGPGDYASNVSGPDWMLLTMPFLGRLQPREADATGTGVLQLDPVLNLETRRTQNAIQPLPDVALVLANRADDAPLSFSVSSLDTTVGRLFARLDPATLEENWMRLQHPARETDFKGLQSVMATLPDTPARLSRAIALRHAFDTGRSAYPPLPAPENYTPPGDVTSAGLVWRKGSLMLVQGFSPDAPAALRKYAWHLVGLQITGSALGAPSDSAVVRRFAAATLIPTARADGPMPVTFSVSPYLGLAFAASKGNSHLRIVAAELLAIDVQTGELRPVGGHFLEAGAADGDATLINRTRVWAIEAHTRLAPDSPLAVVRRRHINEVEPEQPESGQVADDTKDDRDARITTTYGYEILTDLALGPTLSHRAATLRAPAPALVFRQGQFGGHDMPDALQPFEVAPPQVTGVQPLYLTQSASGAAWPWGFSGMRTSVQYTQDKAGVVGANTGAEGANGATAAPLTLWWQAPMFAMQFRSAQTSTRPAASLPMYFRAQAIRSLLPALPDAPLPALDATTEVMQPPPVDEKRPSTTNPRWQPVLPGLLRHVTVGARPGVFFFWRNQLLRQSGLVAGTKQIGNALASGSVPVQHRTPRPVPLPANDPNRKQYALQTWASHFDPKTNALLTPAPADEAFLAECGDQPVHRLRVVLTSPANGVIPIEWDGGIEFEPMADDGTKQDALSEWVVSVGILNAGRIQALTKETIPHDPVKSPDPNATRLRYTLASDKVKTLVVGLADSAVLVTVTHTKTPGLNQVLSLPLRFANNVDAPLPLDPIFVHFEDPEYNRRLSSQAGHATGLITFPLDAKKVDTHAITLSTDRREYNPDSVMALRYDWDDDRCTDIGTSVPKAEKTLTLSHISKQGVTTQLKQWVSVNADANALAPAPKELRLIPLADVIEDYHQAHPAQTLSVEQDDKLQLKLTMKGWDATNNLVASLDLALEVNVVKAPVIPMPEAAYALLRVLGPDAAVECARFAWSPEPARVELVCPDDLRTELVRRRAVFHWQDAARRTRAVRHAIQKITASGSTHWPLLP